MWNGCGVGGWQLRSSFRGLGGIHSYQIKYPKLCQRTCCFSNSPKSLALSDLILSIPQTWKIDLQVAVRVEALDSSLTSQQTKTTHYFRSNLFYSVCLMSILFVITQVVRTRSLCSSTNLSCRVNNLREGRSLSSKAVRPRLAPRVFKDVHIMTAPASARRPH